MGWQSVRHQVAKLGIASIELVVQAAQMREDLDILVGLDLLRPEEAEAMRKLPVLWQRPLTCWAWILRVCLSALDKCHVPEARTTVVLEELLLAKQGITTMNAYMDTQLPFGYVHLITLLVNVQNLIMALKSGVLFAHALTTGNIDLMVQQFVSTLVVAFCYQGL